MFIKGVAYNMQRHGVNVENGALAGDLSNHGVDELFILYGSQNDCLSGFTDVKLRTVQCMIYIPKHT